MTPLAKYYNRRHFCVRKKIIKRPKTARSLTGHCEIRKQQNLDKSVFRNVFLVKTLTKNERDDVHVAGRHVAPFSVELNVSFFLFFSMGIGACVKSRIWILNRVHPRCDVSVALILFRSWFDAHTSATTIETGLA